MKLKQLLAILLLPALFLCACGPEDEPTVTPTPTAAPEATATATATAEASPTAEETPAMAEETPDPATEATPDPATEATPTPKGNIIVVNDIPEGFDEGGNVIPDKDSNFNKVSTVEETDWTAIGSPKLSIKASGPDKSNCLYFSKPTDGGASYYSARLNLAQFIKSADKYIISFKYKLSGTVSGRAFQGVIRANNVFSFAEKHGDGNIYGSLDDVLNANVGEWLTYETEFTVTKADIEKKDGAEWFFCLHMIGDGVSGIYIDDFSCGTEATVPVDVSDKAKAVTKAETWLMNEVVLNSTQSYDDPFHDVNVDLILSGPNGEKLTVPGFWDGGRIWRVRFACTSAGKWTYKTVCTNTSDTGLHNQTSTVTCTKYSGSLDIYKHGFVKTVPGKRYFQYADGTPFFYLGDTHWALGGEPLDKVQKMVTQRVKQKFTVIQSEPIGAKFDFSNGINRQDLAGLRVWDDTFEAIADAGLVHANAEFFYPSSMKTLIENFGGKDASGYMSESAKTELKALARYWVARYGAYPVMWTLGQETDNDFYDYDGWNSKTNPYLVLADYVSAADAYNHPLTAHQENTGATIASNSAFRDVRSHSWYSAQWSPSKTGQYDYNVARDYWNNGQGKVTVLYEGQYCYLWTKNFGARMQGWVAILSGMFGYGWGGQDTWDYLATYSEDAKSDDGVDTITPQDKKAATYEHSLEYPSTYQMGYMHDFFDKTVGEWWTLVPRFDDTSYLKKEGGAMAAIASNDAKTKTVVYFYNFSDPSLAQRPNSDAANAKRTGTLGSLKPNATYHYQWFNPNTGKVDASGTFTSSASGTWKIPEKGATDMVLYVYM